VKRSEAAALIEEGISQTEKVQVWADLGCGSGVFTLALAELLQKGSTILAVDENLSALGMIPSNAYDVNIEKRNEDFERLDFPGGLDGVIMANSLHYVKDQSPFLKDVKNYLKRDACIIIIEYEADQSNPWIPFPISFQSLQQLITDAGFGQIKKLHERRSTIRGGTMYSALIR